METNEIKSFNVKLTLEDVIKNVIKEKVGFQ